MLRVELMSSTAGDAADARERILAEHALLRGLMTDLASLGRAVVHDEKLRPDVRRALAKLRAELERHLRFEETMLVPLLRDADAWGSVRVESMTKEHAEHHAVLLALSEDAGEGIRTVETLSDEMAWFVQSLERHMREEEATLLSEEALGDGSIVRDEIGG